MFQSFQITEEKLKDKNRNIESPNRCQYFSKVRSVSDGTVVFEQSKVEGRVVRGRKNPYWTEFSERLRRARVDSGLTSNALALLAGIDSSQVHFLERGSRPKISTIERLASALCVPACFLAFGERGERPFAFRIPRDEQPLPIGAPNTLPSDELHSGFAKRLTQARELRGISLRELSRCAGISVTAVSNYERSINVPLVDAVEKLAVALDVSPCWLAYGTGDEPQPRVSSPNA